MAAPARDPAAGPAHGGRPATAVITDARSAASREMSGRIRRYTLTMAFRMACFLSMLVVHGWLRWVLLVCAVFLPYIAVVLANQADQRTGPRTLEPGAPADAPQLAAAEPLQIIPGSVEQPDHPDDRPGGHRA